MRYKKTLTSSQMNEKTMEKEKANKEAKAKAYKETAE